MGGIAGFSGSFDPALLDAMSAAIAARGPDDSGSLHLPAVGVGLAHRRLAVNDPSQGGHQPMWDVTGTVAISYDGALYDFRRLHGDLVADGYRFNGRSDTEVILNLYLRDGSKLLESLNGIFAFAIWDSRSRSLLLARDGVGVKPLYYAETPKGFVFASELKALLHESSVERRLDRDAVWHHLHYRWCPSPLTMLESAKKLEPGHAMHVREGRVTKRWRFHDPPLAAELLDWSKEDAVVQVRKRLTRTVDRQLAADVPIGGFLSEGPDSSAVVALAQRRMGKRKLQCFAIDFAGQAALQAGPVAGHASLRMVAAHLNVDLHTVQVGPAIVDELQRIIVHLEEPHADPASIEALLVARLAREHGIKVLLSGAGGSQLFAGDRRPHAHTGEPLWSQFSLPVIRAMRAASASLAPASRERREISEAFRYPDLEGNERIAGAFRCASPGLMDAVLLPDSSHPAAPPVHDRLLTVLAQLPPDTPALQRMMYLDARFCPADRELSRLDKVSMANGIEFRAPLLDSEFLALMDRLPRACRQHGRVARWVFGRAMEPYLPREALQPSRRDAGARLCHWLRSGLRPLAEDALSEQSLRRRGLFDAGAVGKLVQLGREGSVDVVSMVFSVLCVELWCRMFLDGPTPNAG